MNLFKHKTSPAQPDDQAVMSEKALKIIHDGVIITDKSGIVQFINPAAVAMSGYTTQSQVVGLDYGLVIRLESKEGRELPDVENPLFQAMTSGKPLENFQASLIVGQSDKHIPVAISMLPGDVLSGEKVITIRNIAKELAEEGEQAEFVSTASHEMRTPIATIDGYLSLALNPQTAAIDARARSYLTAAQAASKHLGKLFQDLLDVTKLDDGHIRPNFVPAEMVSFISRMVNDYVARANQAKINLAFGSSAPQKLGEARRIEQVVYGFIDVNFMREIMDNLIDNALKYTPEGGSIYVNVRGDGDRVLINVTDTGMGISSDDLTHIFQKFYRADNSNTRTIGGTGLGLHIVKQRTEAMGGRVWAESAFGEGSTFYVSLPRLTQDEYDKRMIAVRNQQMASQISNLQPVTQPQPAPRIVQSQPTRQVSQPTRQVSQPVQQIPQSPPQTSPPATPQAPPQPIQQNINLNGVRQ